ncbi:hypothetical protein WCU47_26125 (plasmid) [Klebsiella quasipneumoniae]|uniref:hypothetical protein n=1 Tax=Klebsiella pneumoniae complex TaxID=3390273 RepID=UPI000CF661FE|nr:MULTISPECIES: hypothetical protein [Klebsiella]HEJ7925913.1 hypothetical protein [Klebsiella michiganensis]EIW9027190.1 hypothetical protein [Klebsiella pneumoniae]EIY5371103.1 hypothetical protein [Klebsiella quasipneumoniae]EJZ8861904.1 hypothetical protein [Klebsiella pneumoniae]EKL1155113.1 hypothetical protein [Klebsiella pneumoniae]
MTGTGIFTVRIGDEVKHITDLDVLTLMHELSKLKKENTALYDYNRQVNRGWRGFILRLMGIHLPDKDRVRLQGINVGKESIYPD